MAAGAVLKHSRDFNLTREAVLGSALSAETPAYDLQQACATGLETVLGLANKIKLGQIDSAIAGGVDSASDAPIAVSEGLREVLLDLNRAKTLSRQLQVLSRLRPKDLAPDAPNTGEPRTGLSMGEHQALTTAQWKITREAQDELAFNSHRNLAAAYDAGFFDDLLTPYRGLTRDSNLRADTSLEKLATLKPVFGKNLGAEATMTAGNSTPLTDGASTVLLGVRGMGRRPRPAQARHGRRRRGCRRRLCPRQGRPADGPGLRGAPAAGPPRISASPTSTSSRSTRPSPAPC